MNQLGLSLSGGGYRAAAFHLGTLLKLEKMKLLSQVDVLSTISGGSITGAAWASYAGQYEDFHKDMVTKLHQKSVIGYVLLSWIFFRTLAIALVFIGGAFYLTLTRYGAFSFPVLILFSILFLKFQYEIFPVSKVIERAYDKFFYNGMMLSDLKNKPILVIGSSNLHTGRPFVFSKIEMGDSNYSREYRPPVCFKHGCFPIARAVAASSCVPFAFSPVKIYPMYFVDQNDSKRVRPVLVDGGVYDNQGIHKLTQPGSKYECRFIITSDAGGKFIGEKKYPNTLTLLLRTVDLFMYRIKSFQMQRNIYQNVRVGAKPIAYFSLGWQLDNIIPGFIKNMQQNQVLPEVLAAHDLQQIWIDKPEQYQAAIQAHLEQHIDYATIKQRDLSAEEFAIAKGIGTNLTGLSSNAIEHLIRHAENLTEIQVKLYCPTLPVKQ